MQSQKSPALNKNQRESIKRKNRWLIPSGKRVRTFFLETAKFKQETRQAMNQEHFFLTFLRIKLKKEQKI
jgi:hypothetical protein